MPNDGGIPKAAAAAERNVAGRILRDPTGLQALDRLANVSLVDVRQQDPLLFDPLSARAAEARVQAVGAAFAGASPGLRDALAKVDFSLRDKPERTLRQLIFDSLSAQKVSADIATEATQRVLELEQSSALVDPAAVTTPISEHPLFQAELQRANVLKIALTANLDLTRAGKVLDIINTPETIGDESLHQLVARHTLTNAQAADVGLTASLYQLAGDRLETAEGLRRGLVDHHRNRVPTVNELARLGADGWARAIDEGKVTPPNTMTKDEFAVQLDRSVTSLFLTDALLARALPNRSERDLQTLLERATGTRPDEMDRTEREAADVELAHLINAHPGLRLGEELTSNLPVKEKARAIAKKLDLIHTVHRLNPDSELLTLDYTPDSEDLSAVNFGDLTAEQRKMVVTDLKAYQRAFAVTGYVEDAYVLVRSGYHSALTIGTQPLKTFQATTKLPEQTAGRYHAAATASVSKLSTSLASVLDIFRGGFSDLEVSNVLWPSIADQLRKLAGFEELFGNQDYCNCSHCQSLISPAAYFVDLMGFVDEHVTKVHFTGANAKHALNLKTRRPDLWTLPLTCENTNTLLPYLDIINEICENYLAHRFGTGDDVADQAAVEDFVYRRRLLKSTDSFRQPFHLPLERLSAYLEHFELDRAMIAEILGAPATTRIAAALGVSPREYDLITQPNTDLPFLRRIYGVHFTVPGTGVANPVEVQGLLRFIGVTRDELSQLVATRFVTADRAEPIEIISSKRSVDSVQNDKEEIRGLRATSLDRLHRFVRLRRATPWTIPETDLVLSQLVAAGVPPGITEPMLSSIVDCLRIQSRFGLAAERVCPLWGAIPRRPLAGAKASLFTQLFNAETFVRLDGYLPDDTLRFVHPSLRRTGFPSPADSTLHRLLAALGVSDAQLAQLIGRLAGPLGAHPRARNEDDRGFLLTADNLTLLYRHARLGQLLKLSVADLFALITLSGIVGEHVSDLNGLRTLLSFHDWRKTCGLSLDDLALITHAEVRGPTVYPEPQTLAAMIVSGVQADKALEFADTLFAFVPGVTEEQSRSVIAANAGAFETVDSSLRLVPSFDPNVPVTVPVEVTTPEPQLRAALLAHHAATLLPARLAGQLATTTERIAPLMAMTGVNPGSAEIVQALHGGTIDPLVTLVRRLVPLTVMFKAKAYDADGLDFLRTHGAIFGIVDYTSADIAGLRKLDVYRAFAAAGTETIPPLDAADLRHVFATFDPTSHFANTDPKRLANVVRAEPALVATLLPHLTLSPDAPSSLELLGRGVALATSLGLGGEALALAVSDRYSDLEQASEAVLSAIRAKYPDENEFNDRTAPFADRIRGRRRDALTDYLIRSVHPEFEDQDDIYEYFLVDCQLEGCARTSRLVAAISSVQLYIHRVLMNLEQDRRDPGHPQHIATTIPADAVDEWAWRKNYRVWEANRKVFLWPENYLEPDLRDDKTPLFAELESTLLQQTIDEQNVLDGYGQYLAGLEEVAKLQLAGAYHHKDAAHHTDLLHLFGVTPGDPPVYYHRKVRNAHYGETDADRGVAYGPWEKIDVQIPVRKVAPVVHLGRLFMFWVEIATTPQNQVKDAGSTFVGYKHRITLKYTTLRLDGDWSPPQDVSLSGDAFPTGDGIVEDPLVEQAETDEFNDALTNFGLVSVAASIALKKLATPRYDTKAHFEPIESYTIGGFQWNQVYPRAAETVTGPLTLTARNFRMRADVDFYRKAIVPRGLQNPHPANSTLLSSRPESGLHRLYASSPVYLGLDDYPHASIVADRRRLDALASVNETKELAALLDYDYPELYTWPLAWLFIPPDISVVNGSIADAVIDLDGDLLYVQGSVRPGALHIVKRLGSTLGEPLSRTLFTGGMDALLATSNQLATGEKYPMILPTPSLRNCVVSGRIDFRGAFGTYCREIFFHIPFLLASQLNKQQNFAAAQRWYRYIFDPTAVEKIDVPSGLPPEERARRELDRVWRYSEFRNLDLPKLRDVLTDPAAIEAYKSDPFNPHAIARQRLSAYQKCIVMRYVDNLLDWGDSLFSQFTMESVNEATMHYVTAGQILGRRPAELGSCGEGAVTPKTYEKIAPLVARGSEFLVELENLLWIRTGAPSTFGTIKRKYTFALDPASVRYFTRNAAADRDVSKIVAVARPPLTSARPAAPRVPVGAAESASTSEVAAARKYETTLVSANVAAALRDQQQAGRFSDWKRTYISSWSGLGGTRRPIRVIDNDKPLIIDFARAPRFGWSVIRQLSPVFCVPANPELRSYWNRVEDRLYKLRHCLDITGIPRQLALFAPEMDPRLLVRARAAGLSIQDVLASTSGDLPPYRFPYLIEKAKQHTSIVQSFGAALLSAIEKKDLEELNRLRATHQHNLLKMTTRVREWDIDIAADTITTLQRQNEAAQYKHDYYQALLGNDLLPTETVQQVSRHAASILHGAAGLLRTTAGITYLIPQVGSPFAMKYGGQELGNSSNTWAMVANDAGSVAEAISSSAGMEAGFERRRDDWEHQRKLAEHELEQLEKPLASAEIRRQIAIRSLALHNKEIEQTDEIIELYGDRFSNLGLYTWLSTTMQRLYREAYNSAYATARLAEQAYRFERNDETTTLLRGNYFDASRAGLLAGEQLLVDVDTMERRFIETNYRTPEVGQSFSLTQIDPTALVRLRETGKCAFEIPEVFFDLFYPGQYCRRIKAVRLTIPSVTGPYTNVGATLALTGSRIRRSPSLGAAKLVDVPLRRSVSIATSTAQNDAGVFEFSFRDERYMPFEGAGAVSSWQLTLPKTFRSFDYQTIADVIMHISYTAEIDEVFRGRIEDLNATIDGTILNYLSNNPLNRVHSLHEEFSIALHRIVHSAADTPVTIELTDRHLPAFQRGRELTVTSAKVLLRTPAGQSASGFTLRLDTTNLSGFTRDPALGNLYTADASAVFASGALGERTVAVTAPGALAPDTPQPGDPSALDQDKLLDIALFLQVQLA